MKRIGTLVASAAAAVSAAAALLVARRRRGGRATAAPDAEPEPSGPTIVAPVEVVDDDVLRERARTSLNRLCDISDWEIGTPLTDRMRDMREPVGIHRKSWEYAVCVTGLEQLGVVTPEAAAVAVGAGSERPLFHFANEIERMVATDLYDNPLHEGTPAMLSDPASFAHFPYRTDHLEVRAMPGDALEFADDTFDFAFCLSSIEHFGSRETQRRALGEMARVVRPGGIVCIITELILTDHHDREYFRWEEIETLFLAHPGLTLVGGEPDLTISRSLVEYPTAYARSARPNAAPHIVLERDGMLWTSLSMFLRVEG